MTQRASEQGLLREALRNKRLLGVALIAAIGGFLFGYDTADQALTRDQSGEREHARA